MKLQIIRGIQEAIDGYQIITVNNDSLDLGSITANECEFILASDVMDSFSINHSGEILGALRSKLRINGELVVGGTELRAFVKAVANGLIAPEDASSVVSQNNSMTSVHAVREMLMSLGLEIVSSHINGLHYEIKAKRVK
jgi:hypothetical protein